MSVASQITRIQQDRNTIRAKLVALGLATNTDNLDVLAEAVDEIVDQGAVSASVKEGETYTIPKGYHSGSGTVSGIAGGGNYTLQSKAAITPTKKQQQVTPDDGYYGLSDVTIGAIPDAYQDVTSVTAAAGDVLTGKVIVSSTGVVTTGTMANNGAVDKTLDTTTTSYTVPAGYHNGEGTVKIDTETKSATPTKSAQDITPTAGKVLSKVTVAAIPDAYQDVTAVTATAMHVLSGNKFVSATGEVVTGTMPNNEDMNTILSPSEDTFTIPAGYHNGQGVISVSVGEDQTITPTKETQTIGDDMTNFYKKVVINPIPAAYQDVTSVTAVAGEVLEGKIIVSSTGEVVEGSMANKGAITATIDGLTTLSYTIPAGYHNGEGTVSLTSDIEDALAAI